MTTADAEDDASKETALLRTKAPRATVQQFEESNHTWLPRLAW